MNPYYKNKIYPIANILLSTKSFKRQETLKSCLNWNLIFKMIKLISKLLGSNMRPYRDNL